MTANVAARRPGTATVRVGVSPRSGLDVGSRLCATLGEAFGVAFEQAADARPDLHAWIAAADDELGPHRLPTLVLPAASHRSPVVAQTVRFGAAADPRLAGRAMSETATPVTPLEVTAGERVLAWGGDGPLWTLDDRGQAPVLRSGACVPALAPATPAQRLLTAGTFLGLLPLVDLLRRVTHYDEWDRPPICGAIIIDDPNLRAMRYGFLHFGELAGVVARAGGHVVMATVPVDHRSVSPRAAAVFRGSRHLSLAVHGNNHTKHELARGMHDPAFALATAAQAMRRSRALAERANLPVSLVMVPPHEVTSRQALAPLARVGFESVCWMGPVDAGPDTALLGWDPADVHLGGGLPGLHRDFLHASTEQMAWRAYLDQPVLVHGHHADLAEGSVVVDITDRMHRAGVERFAALEAVSRSRLLQRRRGSALEVRPYARVVELSVDGAVDELVVTLPRSLSTTVAAVQVADQVQPVVDGGAGPFVLHRAGAEVPRPVRLELVAADRVDPRSVADPAAGAWPLARRLLTEARDRAEPLTDGLLSSTRRAIRRAS